MIGIYICLVCIMAALIAEYQYIRTVEKALQDLIDVLLDVINKKRGDNDK